MADKGQRTEEPTPRRLERARKEGQFPVSREFVAALHFLAFVWLVVNYAPEWLESARRLVRGILSIAFRTGLDAASLTALTLEIVRAWGWPLAMAGGGLCLLMLGAQLVSTQFGVASKRLAPDLARLNPVNRLKQLPGQNMQALIYSLLLLPLFAWVVAAVAKTNWTEFETLPFRAVESAVALVGRSLSSVLWQAALLLCALGFIDLLRQRQRHSAGLRMSKQEIKEEQKETEGNVEVKLRIRRLQRELLRRQMMKQVPKATAVIVNPTHFAVAIRYVPSEPGAPKVIAKGKNYLALRIRRLAIEHQVPIIENPPLAQALYRSVAVGQEIPVHLYQAVAEVLAYIYRLMKGRLPR